MNADSELAPLLRQAIEVAARAYVPYSHYAVGAALRAVDGTVYTGCNVENASYPVTICAERAALVKAISEGRRAFDLVVVVTSNGGSPCGMCRQMLYEFAPTLRVVMADLEGRIHADQPLNQMLALGFGPESLPR